MLPSVGDRPLAAPAAGADYPAGSWLGSYQPAHEVALSPPATHGAGRLYINQFAFRKNSNTSEAIIEFLDCVYSSLDKQQSTIAVHLYFSKAFDTVNHDLLMSKRQQNGVRGDMHSWFKSYLSNGKQYFSVKNFSSSMSNTTLGVPQGSVLGPVLFILLINGMLDSKTRCVLFILLTKQQFSHPTVTITISCYSEQITGRS